MRDDSGKADKMEVRGGLDCQPEEPLSGVSEESWKDSKAGVGSGYGIIPLGDRFEGLRPAPS